MDAIEKLQERFRLFSKERNWERFHSPKNLSMSLAAEAAELMEIFMWLTEEQSKNLKKDPELFQNAQDEIGDVFLCLLSLADTLQIDLMRAVHEKFAKVEQKYPVDKALSLGERWRSF